MKFALIMPAAGSGERLGLATPKALVSLAGHPMFVRAALPFIEHVDCVEAIVAAPAGFEDEFEFQTRKCFINTGARVVAGGASRQESVGLAIRALTSRPEAVLIHDAARPMVGRSLIDRVLQALRDDFTAVVPGIAVADTIKEIDGEANLVVRTLDRSRFLAAQTPQGIRYSVVLRAHRLAQEGSIELTDDVALVEYFGLGPVGWVIGDPNNFKITLLEDLTRAELLIQSAPDSDAIP